MPYQKKTVRFDEESYELVLPFLLNPFTKEVLSYRFDNELSKLNKITDAIFKDEDSFMEGSKNIVNHLYEQSNSATIKNGDVLVVFFDGIEYKDVLVEAIGIFKIETKTNFLQTYLEDGNFDVVTQSGISIKKFDKGCLILNTSDDNGRVVLSIDNNNYDAQYWNKNFLDVKYSDDKNLHTHIYLDMCKQFADDVIIAKKEKGEFLSGVLDHFKENETVVHEELKEELFETKANQDLFAEYKNTYESFNDAIIRNSVEVSDPVVKKEKSKLKTEIKLDTNIKISLDVDAPDAAKEYLELGYDEEKKMKYYKVYFNAEK